ncbi:nucleotide disphospho-sugar-binding domain-containing protein [Streptomyces sp. NPDC059850]|uniref:nucleotide disphospho-sugar-binding domain-containing protein n=1 Tax=Streptomyces sp. NPDC059850 TaxID=3346970 RepID=UPI003650CE50
MRVLFVTGGGQATVFSLAPLATALRSAGHEIFMAANRDLMSAAEVAAIPVISMTDLPIRHFISQDRQGRPVPPPLDAGVAQQGVFTGRWFGRMAAASLGVLKEFTAAWRPDVVVGGTMAYAAPLLAPYLGIPWVRLAWDAIDARHVHRGADEELQPELRELGLSRLPEPDLFIDVCPPSLRPAAARPASPMRYVPANRQRQLEPGMYTRGDRRRICLTAGSQVTRDGHHKLFDFLTRTVSELAPLDADILIAAPDGLTSDLREACGDVHAGWFPLDVVAPTCDLLVHHGGGVTSLTGMYSGTPQVIVPGAEMLVDQARRLADYGAAVTLKTGEDAPDVVGAACREVVSDTSYATRARALRKEILAMPSPNQMVGAVAELAHR